ncbi:MAG: hypothetical protein GX791_08520, partial [Synergistaceae bacterium]|nr:hypothetical protein [Synergistaceae bacterium]
MAIDKIPLRKRVRDWAAGIVIGAALAGFLFSAGAADLTDLERITPFPPQSLWLLKQARAIIETYQVDSES